MVALAPDRVAVYGYAHLPSQFKAQQQIEAAELPDLATCLACAPLQRNLTGYYTHGDGDIVGPGVSAIGRIWDSYNQNALEYAGRGSHVLHEWLRYSHLVWHLCALADTGCHYLVILRFAY